MRLQYFLIALLVLIPVVIAENNTPTQLPTQILPSTNFNFTLNKTQKPSEINNIPYISPDVTLTESDKIFSMTTNNVCLSKPLFYLMIGMILILLIVTLWIWFTSRFVF
jgi:hypothetical protein